LFHAEDVFQFLHGSDTACLSQQPAGLVDSERDLEQVLVVEEVAVLMLDPSSAGIVADVMQHAGELLATI
jgi:hypothetical protein